MKNFRLAKEINLESTIIDHHSVRAVSLRPGPASGGTTRKLKEKVKQQQSHVDGRQTTSKSSRALGTRKFEDRLANS